MSRRRAHIDDEIRPQLVEHGDHVGADGDIVRAERYGGRPGTRRDKVDPGSERHAGRMMQLVAPVWAKRARADDHAAQRSARIGSRETHRSNQPAGDSTASGAPPCWSFGAAHRTALASTRRMSGWW